MAVGAMQFISSNPAGEAFDQGIKQGNEQRDADFRNAEQLRQIRNSVALDNAQRAYVNRMTQEPAAPQPAPAAPAQPSTTLPNNPNYWNAGNEPAPQPAAQPVAVAPQAPASSLREFTSVPGGGAMAMGQMKDRNAMQHQIAELLKSDDPAVLSQARAMAQQNSINIPDQVFTDKLTRAKFNGHIAALQNFAKLKGMPFEQFTAALDSGDTSALGKVLPQIPEEIKHYEATNQGLMGFDKFGNPTQIQDENGAPVNRAYRSGSGGATSVFQQKQAAWLQTHPGDSQGALEYASGRRQIGAVEINKMAITMAQNDRKNDFTLQEGPAFQQRVKDYVTQLGGNHQPSLQQSPSAAQNPGLNAALQDYQNSRAQAVAAGRQDLVQKIDQRARANGVIR